MAWHLHVTLLHERFSSSKKIYGITKIIKKIEEEEEKCVKYMMNERKLKLNFRITHLRISQLIKNIGNTLED